MEWMIKCLKLRGRIMRYNANLHCNEYLLAGLKDTQQVGDMSECSPMISNYFRIRTDIKDGIFDYNERLKLSGLYKKINDMVYNAAAIMNSPDSEKYNKALVVQVAACNFRCPFCYVDDKNLDPEKTKGVGWFSARKIVKTLSDWRDKYQLNRLRISGGEPSLAPEMWLEILQEIDERDLSQDVYVYADTNLSNYYLIEYLMSSEDLDRNIFQEMSKYTNFGVWASIKGNTIETFLESTGLKNDQMGLILKRYQMLEWLVSDGLDVYINLYNFDPVYLSKFFEELVDRFGQYFWQKSWIQPIKMYSVVADRMNYRGIHLEDYQTLLDDRFIECVRVLDGELKKIFNQGYRQVPRWKIKR